MGDQTCKFCRNKMAKEHLIRHIQRKHEHEMEMVYCEYCLNRMPQFSIANHQVKKHAVTCLYCDYTMIAANRSSLKEHVRNEHAEINQELENIFKDGFEKGKLFGVAPFYENCIVCNLKFLKTNLEEHLKSVHTADIVPVKSVFTRRTQRTVITNVERLYRNTRSADVFFVFKNDTENETHIPAHKCILASDSLIFRRMFYGELKEVGDITIVDASAEGFLVFLQSFYTSNVNITNENVSEVMYLANKYDAVRCTAASQIFLEINLCTNNVLTILKLAIMYNCALLQLSCVNKIICHGPSIIQTEEFYHCDRDVLKEILSTNFQGRDEFILFEACVKWAKQLCEKQSLDPSVTQNIRTALGECFNLIKFHSMTPLQFIQCQSNFGDMFSNVELKEISKELAANVSCNLDAANSTITSQRQGIPCKFLTTIVNSFGAFTNLFGDEETADVFFVFKTSCDQSKRIPAHQCILAYDSTVFDHLFFDDVIEDRSLEVKGTDVDEFLQFLQPFYGNIIKLTMENVSQIMHFANEYLAKTSLYACDEFLESKLCVENALWIFELSHRYRRAELHESCKNIIEKHQSLLTSTAFLNWSRDTVKHLVMVDFVARNEFVIFQACIKWAKHTCEIPNIVASIENIRETLGDIFSLIRFTSMTTTEFIECLINYGAMFNVDTLKNILIEAR